MIRNSHFQTELPCGSPPCRQVSLAVVLLLALFAGVPPLTADEDSPSRRRCCLHCQPLRDRPALFVWPGQVWTEEDIEEGPIETDRPDFTEASSVVGRGRVQLEMGYTYIDDESGDTHTRTHSLPETLLRVGMVAEWFEFRIFWNHGSETTNSPAGSLTLNAAEDLYLGAKLALTLQDGIFPEMALMPQMTVPTAPVDDGFGTGEVMPGVNWLYGWDITEKLSAGGSTQVNRALDDGGKFYAEFAQSFTTGYAFTDKLKGYAEYFGFYPHGALTAEPQHYFDGGFTYLVTDNFQLDIRSGVGLNAAADDYFGGLGASYRY